jgi:PAS domain S-box-containing protein
MRNVCLTSVAVRHGIEVELALSENDREQSAGSRFTLGVSTLLVILSLASVVPLLLFVIFSLSQIADRARTVDKERLAGQVINISSTIDNDIETMIAAGGALATSPSLAERDYRAFYQEAKLAMNYAKGNVLLLDPSLQQLLNTRVAFGQPLPKTANPEHALRVLKSGEMDVSGIFLGQVSKMPVFNVTIPIKANGVVTHLLIVAGDPRRVESAVKTFWKRPGWEAAVVDRSGVVFASTQPAFLGKGEFKDKIASQADTGLVDMTLEGIPATVAYARSPTTGWTTFLWAPHSVLDAPLAPTWRNLYSAGLVAIVLSALLAYFFQRPFTNLIRQTLGAVSRIGQEGPLPNIKSLLSEGKDIRASLAAADASLRESRREAEESKALLTTLLEHSPDGITIVGGPDFRVIANSRVAIEMTGRTAEELKVTADAHAEKFGIWFPDGLTRPEVKQLPLYRASRLGEQTSEEFFALKRPDGTQIMIEASVNPVRDAQGKIIGAVSCWRDVTQRFLADRVIADNEKRLRLALDVARMAIVDLDLRNGVVASVTDSTSLLGIDAAPGEAIEAALSRLFERIHPEDQIVAENNKRRALEQSGPFSSEFRIIRADGTMAWIEVRGETIVDESRRPVRLLAANVDISHRKRADEQLQLVLRELTHRAKNLLTVILAIATQTARRHTTVEQFIAAFSSRIQGLGASHDLLVKRDWAGVPIADLIETQLAPFGGVDGRRVTASGPSVNLRPDVLQNLGLALHELATNASKYGALSRETGSVAIEWSVGSTGPEQRFLMTWRERGGPRFKAPTRKGFGHVIIERSLAQVINGDVELNFDANGVTWTVDAPLQAIVATS